MKEKGYNHLVSQLYQSVQERGVSILADEERNQVVQLALTCLESSLKQNGFSIESMPTHAIARRYIQCQYANETEREAFGVLFLNVRQQMLAFEILFKGTVSFCSIHIREIIRRALALNSSGVIISHNHPSGNVEPSVADIKITENIKCMTEYLNIKLVDHIIVSGERYYSFFEEGRL